MSELRDRVSSNFVRICVANRRDYCCCYVQKIFFFLFWLKEAQRASSKQLLVELPITRIYALCVNDERNSAYRTRYRNIGIVDAAALGK